MPSPTEVGRAAESVAARWLQKNGFQLLDQNWRTRWCELDLVALRSEKVHFIEVKYRRRPDFGTGFEYITASKSQRLQRAALMWLKAHGRSGDEYQIDVISVSGFPEPKDVDYLPNAIAEN